MEIILNRGIDQVVFGMSEDQVIEKLGPFDKVFIDSNGSRDLIFYEYRVILKIEPNQRLGWISVCNSQTTWSNILPWVLSKELLLEKLSQEIGEPFLGEDYGVMESYSSTRSWVEVQFEFGKLSSFNFGVPYDDMDRAIWPD